MAPKDKPKGPPWVRIDATLDAHPDVMAAGFVGAAVFQLVIRRCKLFQFDGRLPAKFVSAAYLAKVGNGDEAMVADGLGQCYQAGLLVAVNGEVEIPGWDRFQNPGTQRMRKTRQEREATAAKRAKPKPDKGPEGAADTTPYDALISAYNAICVPAGASKCIHLGGVVRKHLHARWTEVRGNKAEFFQRFFDIIAASPFLCGKVKSNRPGRRPFRVTLEWATGPENFAKIVNGVYLPDMLDRTPELSAAAAWLAESYQQQGAA